MSPNLGIDKLAILWVGGCRRFDILGQGLQTRRGLG